MRARSVVAFAGPALLGHVLTPAAVASSAACGAFPRGAALSPTPLHAAAAARRPATCPASRAVVTMADGGGGSAAPAPPTTNKMAHVVYRVADMEATKKFYCDGLGMKVVRSRENKDEGYANVFFGYGPERHCEYFSIETTLNFGRTEPYDIGTGFGHMGLAFPDIKPVVEAVRACGVGAVTREVGPVKGGTSIIAFVRDPDGYMFELIQRPARDPIAQVMLRVGDMDKAIAFYTDGLGMKLLRKRDVPDYKYTLGFVGYGPEEDSTVIELTYNYGVDSYEMGDGYGQVAIACEDIYKAADAVKAVGGTIAREPGPVPGIGTRISAVRDSTGWKTVLVDEGDLDKEFDV